MKLRNDFVSNSSSSSFIVASKQDGTSLIDRLYKFSKEYTDVVVKNECDSDFSEKYYNGEIDLEDWNFEYEYNKIRQIRMGILDLCYAPRVYTLESIAHKREECINEYNDSMTNLNDEDGYKDYYKNMILEYHWYDESGERITFTEERFQEYRASSMKYTKERYDYAMKLYDEIESYIKNGDDVLTFEVGYSGEQGSGDWSVGELDSDQYDVIKTHFKLIQDEIL